MEIKDLILKAINKSIETKKQLIEQPEILEMIEKSAGLMTAAFNNGKKVLFCGNGGSAADAQHLAGELSGKFYLDREPLYAEPLNINTSFITAIANDFSYEEVFSRLIKAGGRPGDVLVAISTSGNSANIIKALEAANEMGMSTIGFTGKEGGKMKEYCQFLIKVPSVDTPRIQEAHILIGHTICQIVEDNIFNKKEKITEV